MGIDIHILYVYHSFLFSFRLIVDLSPEVVSPVKYFNRHRQKIDFPACQENQGCPLPLPEPIKKVITVDIFTQPDLILFTFGQIWVGARNRHRTRQWVKGRRILYPIIDLIRTNVNRGSVTCLGIQVKNELVRALR